VKKRVLCAIACLTLGIAGAAADEMPTAPAVFVLGPTDSLPWKGVYVGANGGFGWGRTSISYMGNDPASFTTAIPPMSAGTHGPAAGGQIGFNYQINQIWVAGAEADFQWASLKATQNSIFGLAGIPAALPKNPFNETLTLNETVNSFGTLRARTGVVPFNALYVYGTAGFAFGQFSESFTTAPGGAGKVAAGGFSYACVAGVPCFSGSASRTGIGWTGGAGAELAISNNLTFKTEILYVSFGRTTANIVATGAVAGTAPSSFTATSAVNFSVVRLGVNYKFY